MTWTLKRESQCRVQECTAGFGKLPCHSEFIQYHLFLPEIIALDQWYQEAYRIFNCHDQKENKSLLSQMPPYHFLFSQPSFPLIGTVYASVDFNGRNYPFVLVRNLMHPLATQFITTVPLLYQNYFHLMREFLKKDWTKEAVTTAFQCINKLMVKTQGIDKKNDLGRVLTVLKETSWQSYWQGCLPLSRRISSTLFFAQLIKACQYRRNPLKEQKYHGFRLPVSQNVSLEVSVVFYLQLFEAVLPLSQFTWQIYWQEAGQNRFRQLIFLWRPLKSEEWHYFLKQCSYPQVDRIIDFIEINYNHLRLKSVFHATQESLYEIIQYLATKIIWE